MIEQEPARDVALAMAEGARIIMGSARVAATALILLVSASCTKSPAALRDPQDRDLTHSLSALSGGAGSVILDAAIRDCHAGAGAGTGIIERTCNFCVVSVGIRMIGGQFSGGATALTAEYEEASATFVRAISYERPDIRTTTDQEGVWAIDRQTLKPEGNKRWAPIPADIAARAGYTPRTGFNAGWSQPEVPEEVRARFSADLDLQLKAASVIDGCGIPEAR